MLLGIYTEKAKVFPHKQITQAINLIRTILDEFSDKQSTLKIPSQRTQKVIKHRPGEFANVLTKITSISSTQAGQAGISVSVVDVAGNVI